MGLTPAEVAYVAAVIDTAAIVRTRLAGETPLPMVAVAGPNTRMLGMLAALTGTKVTTTRRSYGRAACAEHCPDQHQHVQSVSGRWSVSGAKATVLLVAVRPYLRLQTAEADEAIEVGLRAPRKPATAAKMGALGWPLPDGWS